MLTNRVNVHHGLVTGSRLEHVEVHETVPGDAAETLAGQSGEEVHVYPDAALFAQVPGW